MKIKAKGTLAKLALVSATLIWGSSFMIVEDVVDSFPTFSLLAIRFITAAILLSIIFIKRFKRISKKYIVYGSLFGVLLFSAYAFQTFGISFPDNTPGKNAFLTAVYCVIVPFLAWAFNKKKPDAYNIIAAVICLGGIGLVSLTDNMSIGLGDGLTLVGGLFYAFHIIAVAKHSEGNDIFLLTIFQFLTAGICSFIAGLISNDIGKLSNIVVTPKLILSITYLAICCTAIALLFQNVGQKFTEASTASILLSLESVFGVAFSLILGDEKITFRIALGFVMIFIAVIISETKLSFIKALSKSKE